MNIGNIFELAVAGAFFILFLLHIPVMAWVIKTYQGVLTRSLVLYSVLSIIPIVITGICLLFGPKDLSGRLDLNDFYWALVGYLVINLLVCIVFLFTRLSGLTRTTRIMVLLTTIVAAVTSWLAFLGATFVTV